MAKKKDIGLLIDNLESCWHETYNDIVSQYKLVCAKEKVEEGYLHFTPQEMKKFATALARLIATSNILIEWGKELEKSEGLEWATTMMSAISGFKDSKEFTQKLEQGLKDRKASYARS